MARKLIVEIIGDDRSFQRAMGRANRSAGGFASSLGTIGTAAATVAGGIGVGALVVALKRGYDEFSASQKVSHQTAAVLKSTGKAAHVSAKQIGALADAISKSTGIDDEAVQASENLLLTFTKVRNETGKGNDVFTQATKIVQDMSVALGQDAKSSAIQLGKALNDPIKGLTALKRVGVTFDAQQTKTIKKLAETGHHLEAQKLILAELRKEFGGSAAAAGSTFAGSLDKLKNAADEIMGPLVALGVKALQPYLDRAAKWLQNSKNQQIVINKVTDAVKAVSGVIQSLIPIIRTGATVADKIANVFGGWKDTLKIIIGLAIASKIAGIASAFTGSGGLLPAVRTTNTALGGGKGLRGRLSALTASPWQIQLAIIGIPIIYAQIKALYEKLGADFSGIANDVTRKGNPYPVGTDLYRLFARGKAHKPISGRTLSPAELRAYRAGAGIAAPRKMAAGGIVTRPTLALIGEGGPEAVLPLGRGGGHVIHVHVDLDGREIANVLIPQMQRRARRTVTQRGGTYGGMRLSMG